MAMTIAEPTDSGSIDLANSSVNDGTSTVTLKPRVTYTGWWWYYATISGVNGIQPIIDIIYTSAHESYHATRRAAMWSNAVDGDWQDFPSLTYITGSPDKLRCQFSSALAFDTLHVAFYVPYPALTLEQHILDWIESPYVTPTISSTSSGDCSFHTLTERTNGTAGGDRLCPAMKLYAFKITDTTVVTPKNRVLFIGCVHPGETPAQWGLKAAIDLLLSADPRADYLRRTCEFFIYPNINPQGRYGGLYRTAPDSPSENTGDLWDNTGVSELIDATRAAVIADTEGDIHASFDWHGYIGDYGEGSNLLDTTLIDDPDDYENPAWIQHFRNFEATHDLVVFVNPGNFRTVAYDHLDNGNLKLSVTLEAGSSSTFKMPEYLRFGERVVHTLAHAMERGMFPVQATDTAGRVFFS